MTNFRAYLLISFCFALFTGTKVNAQDLHFSQFFEAPLLRNPSLAGLFDGDIRVQGVYRNQWGSITVPYKTGSFNFEIKQPIGHADDFITMGLQLLYDKAGATNFTTASVFPALNYHKSLSGEKRSYLSLGFMGGVIQRRLDRSKITTNSQFDGRGFNPGMANGETFAHSNYAYLDGSVGMTYNSALTAGKPDDNYFIGVAYHHFNRPKNTFYQRPDIELNPKWVFSGGVRFGVSETSYLTLQADQSIQGTARETIGGAMYSVKTGSDYERPDYAVSLGGFLRLQDAFIPVIKLNYNPFAIALSYDINISELKTASQGQGGMELSVTYARFFNTDNSSKNTVRCPKF